MSISEVKDHGDGAKIMTLRDALNNRMNWALIGKVRPSTYRVYKDFVLELSSVIEGLSIKSDRPAQLGDYGGEPMDMRAGVAGVSGGDLAPATRAESSGGARKACYVCNRPGHIVRNCPKQRGGRDLPNRDSVKALKSAEEPRVNAAKAGDDSDDDSLVDVRSEIE
ncbi:MAG: hypothetical protein SEPTF4163_006297 [Sporothrix epigloea]